MNCKPGPVESHERGPADTNTPKVGVSSRWGECPLRHIVLQSLSGGGGNMGQLDCILSDQKKIQIKRKYYCIGNARINTNNTSCEDKKNSNLKRNASHSFVEVGGNERKQKYVSLPVRVEVERLSFWG